MLKGWKTYLVAATGVLTAIVAGLAGELSPVAAILAGLGALGIGTARAKLERMVPTNDER